MHTLFTSLSNKVLFGQSTLPFNPFQFRPLILNRTHHKPREATVNIPSKCTSSKSEKNKCVYIYSISAHHDLQ